MCHKVGIDMPSVGTRTAWRGAQIRFRVWLEVSKQKMAAPAFWKRLLGAGPGQMQENQVGIPYK